MAQREVQPSAAARTRETRAWASAPDNPRSPSKSRAVFSGLLPREIERAPSRSNAFPSILLWSASASISSSSAPCQFTGGQANRRRAPRQAHRRKTGRCLRPLRPRRTADRRRRRTLTLTLTPSAPLRPLSRPFRTPQQTPRTSPSRVAPLREPRASPDAGTPRSRPVAFREDSSPFSRTRARADRSRRRVRSRRTSPPGS